jgi:hypothetical protein
MPLLIRHTDEDETQKMRISLAFNDFVKEEQLPHGCCTETG